MMYQLMEIHRRSETADVERSSFAQYTEGQLVEGENVYVDQCESLLHAEQTFHSVA